MWLLWLLMILLCTGLLFIQVIERIQYYYKWPVAADFRVKYDDSIQFPAVTICNQNTYRKTTAYKFNQTDIIKYMFTRNVSGTDVLAIPLKELAYTNRHTAQNMIVRCSWAGTNCSDSDFHLMYTDHGVCYTFNGKHSDKKRYVTKAGTGAFELVINSETYEYMVGRNSGAGIKFLIHDRNVFPLVDEVGLSISTDTHAIVGITKTKISNLKPPHGTCGQTPLRYFDSTYNVATCQLECIVQEVIDRCNCTEPYVPQTEMTSNIDECTVQQYMDCVRNVHEDSLHDSDSRKICFCPNPCEESSFNPSFSYASLSDFAIKQTETYMDMTSLQESVIRANDVNAHLNGMTKQDRESEHILRSFASEANETVSRWNHMFDRMENVSKLLFPACFDIYIRRGKQMEAMEQLKTLELRYSQILSTLAVNDFLNFNFQWENTMETLSNCIEFNRSRKCDFYHESLLSLIVRRSKTLLLINSMFSEFWHTYKNISPDAANINQTFADALESAINDTYQLQDLLNLINSGNATYSKHDHNLNTFTSRSAELLFLHHHSFENSLFNSLQLINEKENRKISSCKDAGRTISEMFLIGHKYIRNFDHSVIPLTHGLRHGSSILREFYSSATKKHLMISKIDPHRIHNRLASLVKATVRDLASLKGVEPMWRKLLINVIRIIDETESSTSAFHKMYPDIDNIMYDLETLTEEYNDEVIRHSHTYEKLLTSIIDRLAQVISNARVDSTFYRKNFIHLSISFHELSHVHIRQQPAYDIYALMSDIGGSMGLFIGASLVSLFELIDFIVNLSVVLLKREDKESTAI